MNRWRHILVQVLVAAQLLAVAPLASAFPVAESADEMPCAEMTDECPCCPEGADSVAACLSACVGATGMPPSYTFCLVHSDTPRARLPVVIAHSRVSEPPTKPPPIA